jgi:hypothetical protein
MLDDWHAEEIASRYSLGADASLSGHVARGELGQVWQLVASRGLFAVKELFEPLAEANVREEADYQEAARAAGVPTPAIIRANDGCVLSQLGQLQVRVYEWVDLCERDAHLDPVEVGGIVAAIHRLRFMGDRPIEPWYTEPVGRDRWDELVGSLETKGAPFTDRLREYRDELVALEGLLEPPAELQTCHRDLWAENVRSTLAGRVCVIDWRTAALLTRATSSRSCCSSSASEAPNEQACSTARTSTAVGPAESIGAETSRCSSLSSVTSANSPAGDGSSRVHQSSSVITMPSELESSRPTPSRVP